MQTREADDIELGLNFLRVEVPHQPQTIEADGRKLPSKFTSNIPEMSSDTTRMGTFKTFPHKQMILKLYESGYFYSGDDDATICHQCHVIVCSWKDDDDPQSFHESSCRYHRDFGQSRRSYRSTVSILDKPNQDNPRTAPLSPTVLTPAQRAESIASLPEHNPSTNHNSRFGYQEQSYSDLEISKESSSLHRNLREGALAPMHLDVSPSEVELSVGSNDSERAQTVSHLQRNSNQSVDLHMTTDTSIHLPIQVSDEGGDIIATEPGAAAAPEPGEHSGNLGQMELYNTRDSEWNSHLPPVPHAEEPSEPMQTETEWASAFTCDEPEHPDMRSISNRSASFNAYWTDRVFSDIDRIIQAGFYCFDFNKTRCWYCGRSRHEWMPGDDPWEVHATMYPNCEFLLQQKGPDYVADVSSRINRTTQIQASPRIPSPQSPASPQSPMLPESPRFRRYSFSSNSSEDSPFSSMEFLGGRGSNITIIGGNVIRHYHQRSRESQPLRVVDPREEEAKRRQLLQTSLNSEMALTAMEMGFELPMIKRVIKRKIWRTDETYNSPSSLLDDLLHPPGDLDSDSDSDEHEPSENSTGNAATSTGPSSGATGPGGDEGEPRAAANPPEEVDPKELGEKLREFELEKRCKVCLDRDADVVFMPCGHLCTCVECAQALRTCPLCRKRIQKSMKTYSS